MTEKLQRRKNIRLKDYDYSIAGYYLITICTRDRKNFLGEIVVADDSVRLSEVLPNEVGKIIVECWNNINEIYDNVTTDAFCLMPNHVHGIIVIEKGGQGRPPLQKILQGYKSVSTRLCFKYGYKTLWQRGFYEHIIRSEKELLEIREYIGENSQKWELDKYYSK